MDRAYPALRQRFTDIRNLWFEKMGRELRNFSIELSDFLYGLQNHPPQQWQERFHAFAASQRFQGRYMTPESEEALLAYISRWAAMEMTDNAAEMPEMELDPNAFEVTEAERTRAREGLPWWYAKPFELGDGWWEEKFEELAKVAGDKMLSTCRELQALGSLARNVDQLPDDGIDVLQQHVDRVNAAHDEYVQALIDIDRWYLSYIKSHVWVGWLVSRQIEKLAGKLPPRLFDLPSSKLPTLARARAELDHALGKVVKRVDTAYTVAVWTDRAITAIEIATGIIGGIKVIAKEVAEKGIVIAAKLAAKRAAKQVAIQGAAYIAANYVMPQVVATTGIRVDLVLSGVMIVHGIGELKKLRSARNQRLGFAETPTGPGGVMPEKKPDGTSASASQPPAAARSPQRNVDEAIEIIGEPPRVFSPARKSWTATSSTGTRYTYEVIQRGDIDWTRVRTSGNKLGQGLTNAEAARRFGLGPQLHDGSFATLHHLGQDSRGPIVEASTRYHGSHRPLDKSLHSQAGRRRPHPTHPVDHERFRADTRDYWKWRVENQ